MTSTTTLIACATVYFNETPRRRFEPYQPDCVMVASTCFAMQPLVFAIPDNVDSPGTLDRLLAEQVYVLGNRDDRPNGRTERSISVGDVIVIGGQTSRDPSAVFAVDPIGLRRLGPDQWPPRPASPTV